MRAGGWSAGGGAASSGGCSWTGTDELDGAGVVADGVDAETSGVGIVPDGLGLADGDIDGEAVPDGVVLGVGLGEGEGDREAFGRVLVGAGVARLGDGGAGLVACGRW
ncbi:hypothetical protein [Actinomadura montaniterrae]|uniref:Uncharacterized protein n=1 Tax=Actinomadura montaniterrae TaxID=1803903 RepID=A0A6L3W2H7_9ACTN|nr:hypothetical protein [Actinomadura montaniterrae]KAB2384717.1 hypothetical protein F9B16_09730 [Actinomadura montaniterrae]